MCAADYIPLVQGLLGNRARVQGGRITKRRDSNANNNARQPGETIAERVANRRHPLQPIEEYRQQQQQRQQQQPAHIPIPQTRATRSGRGQIPQFESKFIDRLYSARSLNSKGMNLFNL